MELSEYQKSQLTQSYKDEAQELEYHAINLFSKGLISHKSKEIAVKKIKARYNALVKGLTTTTSNQIKY